MPVRLPVTWLDVFTAQPLSGNGLAVVHDADALSDATMLATARETRLSETTFVQRPTAAGADYRNRIFSPPGEMPFAGHPSLGTAVAVARLRGESGARYVQQTHAGLQPVEVALDGELARASMVQEPPRLGAHPDACDVMAAAGLAAGDAHPDLAPQVVSTGAPHLMAPLRDHGALARAAPRPGVLRELLGAVGAIVLYLAVHDAPRARAAARGFFLDGPAVVEDPATGSAAGPLLAYLREHAAAASDSLLVVQGTEMGRPSTITCDWAQDRPRVSGDVVVVAEGHVLLPG